MRVAGLAVGTAVVASLLGGGVATASFAAGDGAGVYTVSFRTTAGLDAALGGITAEPDAVYDRVVKGFTGYLTADEVALLRVSSTVRGISANKVVSGAAQTVTPAVGTVEADLPPTSATTAGAWDGPGLAIIDSGVSEHTDLNVARQINCFGSGDGTDANGHGTGVAGAAAAINNSVGLVGVAPGAPITSVRVLDNKM